VTTSYFHYCAQEDDRLKPIPSFMSRIKDIGKEPECKWSKSIDKKPLNWLSKLSYFKNDFFLATTDLLILKNYYFFLGTTDLLILKNYSKVTSRPCIVLFSSSFRPKFLLSFAEQAREMISPLESKQATEEEIAAKNERRREEERC